MEKLVFPFLYYSKNVMEDVFSFPKEKMETSPFIHNWKEWHITKSILLIGGALLAITGFYAACTLSFDEYGPWIVCSIFVAMAGVITMVYAIILYLLSGFNTQDAHESRRNFFRNSKKTESNEYLVIYQKKPTPYENLCSVQETPKPSCVCISFNTRDARVGISSSGSMTL